MLPIADLVDMMFYYGEVYVMVSQFELSQLLGAFGEDVLYDLVKSKRLILLPCDQHIGVGMYGNGIYSVGLYSRNIETIDELLYKFHREVVKNSVENKRFADKFSKELEQYRYPNQVRDMLDGDIYDKKELSRLTKVYITQYYPSYDKLNSIEVSAIPVQTSLNGFFRIESNLNIDELNAIHQKAGFRGAFSLSSVLLAIGESAVDCYVTSEKSLELFPSLSWCGLYKQRINDACNRYTSSKENIENFHNVEAIEFLSPGAAFMQGKITPAQLLDELLGENSIEFRNWLMKLPNDANLASEVNEAVRVATAQKWQVKVGRILFQLVPAICVSAIAGAGIGTLVGSCTTILDSLIGDKITKGWSPRIFVDKVLRDDTLVR